MNTTFSVVPLRTVRLGEKFLPIERMGNPVYVVRKRRWEREWIKSDRSYISTGIARGVDENGKDGVFSLYDWAVVRRPVPARPSASRVSDFGGKIAAAFRR